MSETVIDKLCDRFEVNWQDGVPERIEDFLPRVAEDKRDDLLKALLALEFEYRLSAGETVSVTEYEARFPKHAAVVAPLFDKAKERLESDIGGLVDKAFIPATEPMSPLGRRKSQTIGPYKLLQKIGEGGMGSVYMAEQNKPVRRRVALKVTRTGLDNHDVISRFEAERQALALMDHPNIAKVFDAGTTEEGTPFFAMELVNGIPVTKYCDKYRLSLDERLNLFVQACRAIQHAHQKSIIHRDIKPSNVVVTQHDGVPVAKVIDFGLAKALQNTQRLTDTTLFTEFGQVVGTLQYMSPEQAEMNALDVDTRSDVYSLGVLLYELLTGSTPIEKQTLNELALDRVLAAIRENEAPPPSYRLTSMGDSASHISEQRKTDPKKLGIILKGDLDWIAVKALEKDRTRRYDTPNHLADDVQRYLTGGTIEARPPSFSYQMQKWIRRYRAEFTVSVLFVSVLVAGLVGTSLLFRRATLAEADAAADAAMAKNERRRADQLASAAQTAATEARNAQAAALFQLANARWHAGQGNRTFRQPFVVENTGELIRGFWYPNRPACVCRECYL